MTVLRSMKDFSSMNITASILLFVTAIAAAVIANSPVAPVYQEFLSHELHFRIGGFNLGTVVKRIKLYNELIANAI